MDTEESSEHGGALLGLVEDIVLALASDAVVAAYEDCWLCEGDLDGRVVDFVLGGHGWRREGRKRAAESEK